jgi:hypothetical protein
MTAAIDRHIRYNKPFLRLKAQAVTLVGGGFHNPMLWHEADTDHDYENAITWTPVSKMPVDFAAYNADRTNLDKQGRLIFKMPGTWLIKASWAVSTSSSTKSSRAIHAYMLQPQAGVTMNPDSWGTASSQWKLFDLEADENGNAENVMIDFLVHITPEKLPSYLVLTATTSAGNQTSWSTDVIRGGVPDNPSVGTTGNYMTGSEGSTLEIKWLGA